MKIVHLTFKLEAETFPVDFGNISLFSFYIVVELIYNVMLVSSVQQNDSVMCIYVYIYIYIHIFVCVCVYIYVYIHTYTVRPCLFFINI